METNLKPIHNTIDDILEKIEAEESFGTLAKFRLNELDILKKIVKDVQETLDARMIEINSIDQSEYEDNNFKVFVGKKKTKKVPLLEGLDQIISFDVNTLLTVFSANAIKPGAYKKLCEEFKLENLTVETIEDKVEVKEINKKFLK